MQRARRRYVVFSITGAEVEREEAIRALNELARKERLGGDGRIWLVHLDGGIGIASCSHLSKDRVIALLNGISSIEGKRVGVRTLGTSGTIKAALSKFGGRGRRTRSPD